MHLIDGLVFFKGPWANHTKSFSLAVGRRGAAWLYEDPLEHLQLSQWLRFSLVAPRLCGFGFFLPGMSSPSLNLHKLCSQVSQKLLSSVAIWYVSSCITCIRLDFFFFFAKCEIPTWAGWFMTPDCPFPPLTAFGDHMFMRTLICVCDQREAQEPPGLALLLNSGAGVLWVVSKVKYNRKVWNLRGYK